MSRYTNAKEIVDASGKWTALIHQVLRPLMTPTRLFYDEKSSRAPNVFQIREFASGSHLTGLRIQTIWRPRVVEAAPQLGPYTGDGNVG